MTNNNVKMENLSKSYEVRYDLPTVTYTIYKTIQAFSEENARKLVLWLEPTSINIVIEAKYDK